MKQIRAFAAVLLAVAAVAFAVPAQAAQDPSRVTVRVYHQAVSATSTTGSGLGTVRTFFLPIAVDGVSAAGQYLTGTLTTVALGMPGNEELRSSNLTYVFGDEADQLVVGGISLYPPTGATLAVGAKTIRPVVGGSGKYFGAKGQVVSSNLGANGWTHVFKLVLP